MASKSIAHSGSRNNCQVSTKKITIQWINRAYKLDALSDSDLSSEQTGGEVLPLMAYTGRPPPPERGTFFSLQVYETVGILLGEVYERVREICDFCL